jgi:hypothetical protein
VIRAALLLVAAVVAVSPAGCSPRSAAPPPARTPATITTPAAAPATAASDPLLGGAMAILERLDEYTEDEAYRQVSDRLAAWHRQRPAPAGPRLEPLLDALPDRLRQSLVAVRNGGEDVRGLRDACWLAGLARQARERSAGGDQVAVAADLFRWTVRSLAIVADPPAVPTEASPGSRWLMPGEILLAGRASAPQRAWVFLELLRQAGIDGVMLATGDPAAPRPWLPAAIIDGEAYLFDPLYGMPVPGPGGDGIATARQAATDPTVLRSMSLADRPYPLQAADVGQLVPLAAADPWSLCGRGEDMQPALDRLRGPRGAVDASALLERARGAIPGSGTAGGLWEFPFETLARRREDPARVRAALQADVAPLSVPSLPSTVAQEMTRPRVVDRDDPDGTRFDTEERQQAPRILRPLFAGRIREFRGDMPGAKEAYLAAQPSRQEIAATVAAAPAEARDGLERMLERMREDAGYWLGVVSLATGDDRPAVDFFQRMTLDEHPQGRWTDAARVNLAAALTGLDRIDEAVAMLRTDESPQRFGSRLRASALRP